ncbi:MAG: hypothetical protein K2R98_07665, partial [Gemmataceae bacterium]|nr:hypothetical protein [Gemmataceae bacterium]
MERCRCQSFRDPDDKTNALLRAALAKSEGAGVRRELISQELQHRMGNLLAVVQAIARQTFA